MLRQLSRVFKVLDNRSQKRYISLTVTQIVIALLDLVGVAMVGLLGALAIVGVQSSSPGKRLENVLTVLGIDESKFEVQFLAVATIASFVFILRTLLSLIFTQRTIRFLSDKGAEISSELMTKLLGKGLPTLTSRSSQDLIFSLTNGVVVITMLILAPLSILIADLLLLIALALMLLYADLVTAISTLGLFGGVGLVMYFLLHRRAEIAGREQSKYGIASNETIIKAIGSYRESFVKNKLDHFSSEFRSLRYSSSKSMSELNFMPFIGKYILESALVLGAVAMGVIQYHFYNASQAVSNLALFIAVGTRVGPAVLRMQQSLLQIKGSIGQAETTLELISLVKFSKGEPFESVLHVDNSIRKDFLADISVQNLYFSYPNSNSFTIENINLQIKPGMMVALVGPSGAGKSTLFDLMLGLLSPNSGQCTISKTSPADAFRIWPGKVAYVPQNVELYPGTIAENVALGFKKEEIDNYQVIRALEISKLDLFCKALPQGIHTQLIDSGRKFSGGQQQRVGVARALYTSPAIIFLDEATSSLDAETEDLLSKSFQELRGETTFIVIAHRLSTVRSADLVIYMEAGRIVKSGTFEEVRNSVPKFDQQAKLMGI
jgi:ABC-type multidrug transport system fused ATPase/permease subunit